MALPAIAPAVWWTLGGAGTAAAGTWGAGKWHAGTVLADSRASTKAFRKRLTKYDQEARSEYRTLGLDDDEL